MRLIAQLSSLLVRGSALMLGLVGATLALASLGGAISPALDSLTHMTPLWLGMGVGAVILGLAFARGAERKAIVILGVVALCGAALLMRQEIWSASRYKPGPIAPGDLKLIQFNAWEENNAPARSLAWLLAQDADIVVIEEGGGAARRIIKGLRAAYPFTSCATARCEPWIFSRKKMTASGALPRGVAGAWAVIEDPAGPIPIIGVHYVWPLPAGRQQAQSAMLVKAASGFDRESLIIAGDFNSTPWSFTLKRQDRTLGLQRWTRALPSWPAGQFSRVATAPAPILPIDHVYTGSDWRAVKVERGPAIGSDHHPVIVTLRRHQK